MNHSGSNRYISLHARADTQAVLEHYHCSPSQCLSVGCIIHFCIIQVLIDLYPPSREDFNKNKSNSHSKYSLVECTHVLSPVIPDKCIIDEDLYYPLSFSNCTTWLIDVHPTWWNENILEVLHIVPLDLQFRHIQLHVTWHVNILHTHINHRPFHIMDACQKCVTMVAMPGNHLGDQTQMHELVFQLLCLMKVQPGCWMAILHFGHWRAGYVSSALSPELLPSSPIWLLLLD